MSALQHPGSCIYSTALVWGQWEKLPTTSVMLVPKFLHAKANSSVYDILIEDYESNPQKSISPISIQSNGKRLISDVRTNAAWPVLRF